MWIREKTAVLARMEELTVRGIKVVKKYICKEWKTRVILSPKRGVVKERKRLAV